MNQKGAGSMPATPAKTLLDILSLADYTERDEILEGRMTRYTNQVVF